MCAGYDEQALRAKTRLWGLSGWKVAWNDGEPNRSWALQITGLSIYMVPPPQAISEATLIYVTQTPSELGLESFFMSPVVAPANP